MNNHYHININIPKMQYSGTSSPDSKLTDSIEDLDLSALNLSNCRGRPKFRFPNATRRLCRSENNSSCNSCGSASSASSSGTSRRRNNKERIWKQLPALGIFWDIENCQVPKNKSASSLVHKIREKFAKDYREAEFVVVCDVKKESPQVGCNC